MKHALTWIAGGLALLLVLAGPAWAIGPDSCGAVGSTFTVDDGPAGPKAQEVANGWICPDTPGDHLERHAQHGPPGSGHPRRHDERDHQRRVDHHHLRRS